MNRKIMYLILIVSIASCFLFTYCSGGGGKYGEVKKILNDYITASEKLNKSLEKADNGKAVAKAMKEYLNAMKDLGPKVEALPEKYPELEDNPPEELTDLVAEFEASMGSLYKAMEKMMEYMDDPDVIKVMEEFENM